LLGYLLFASGFISYEALVLAKLVAKLVIESILAEYVKQIVAKTSKPNKSLKIEKSLMLYGL